MNLIILRRLREREEARAAHIARLNSHPRRTSWWYFDSIWRWDRDHGYAGTR